MAAMATAGSELHECETRMQNSVREHTEGGRALVRERKRTRCQPFEEGPKARPKGESNPNRPRLNGRGTATVRAIQVCGAVLPAMCASKIFHIGHAARRGRCRRHLKGLLCVSIGRRLVDSLSSSSVPTHLDDCTNTPLNCWSPRLRRHKSTVATSKSALQSEPVSRADHRTLPVGALVRSRELQLVALPCCRRTRVARAFVGSCALRAAFCAHACVSVRMRGRTCPRMAKTKGCVTYRKIPPPRPMGWAEFRNYSAASGPRTLFFGTQAPVPKICLRYSAISCVVWMAPNPSHLRARARGLEKMIESQRR